LINRKKIWKISLIISKIKMLDLKKLFPLLKKNIISY